MPAPVPPTPPARFSIRDARSRMRGSYQLVFEVGLILALVSLIGLTQAPLHPSAEFEVVLAEQEVVEIEEIAVTKQDLKPPPPPKPRMVQVVADDVILDDVELDLDATFDINEAPEYIPEPPAPPLLAEEPDEEEEPEIFVVVEEMPTLVGGLASIQQCIRYPEIAKKAGVEGRVIVQFVVDRQGKVTAPIVLRGIGAGCDEEALRCVSQAQFEPGKQRGKAVPVKFSIPVTFRLQGRDK